MPKYLIWDFDGTLGYREGGWTGAMEEVLRRNLPDCVATAGDLRPHIQTGYPWHAPHQPYPVQSAGQWWDSLAPVFARAFLAVGATPPQAEALAGEVRHAYCHPAAWRLFEDTRPALEQLAAEGWTHVLLSNHVPELSAILSHLQIESFFARTFNSAETGYEKPHPQAFRNVLAALAEAKIVWMIGDSAIADIAGAGAVGIPGILVRKRRAGVRYQCESLSGVAAILSRETSPVIQNEEIGGQTDWSSR